MKLPVDIKPLLSPQQVLRAALKLIVASNSNAYNPAHKMKSNSKELVNKTLGESIKGESLQIQSSL